MMKAYVLPGVPHPLLAPNQNPGWKKIREAYDKVRQEIEALNPDVLMIYSTYWPSVIGHLIQADPSPEWTHVDEEFHYLGSIPYKLKIDTKLAETYKQVACEKGLHARTVSYKGFPIDTGSVVCLKLLNPDNRFSAVITSSNVYADRAETIVLGKSAREAVEKENKTAVAIVVTSLSNRLHSDFIDPKDDKIHSLKDEEWNKKFLEFFEAGRLEDISQLSRQFHREARVHKVSNFKPFWWLASVMGQNNKYLGEILEYQPIFGSGAAVIGLTPTEKAARDLEFDEEDPSFYPGERNVLDSLGKDPGSDGFEFAEDGNVNGD